MADPIQDKIRTFSNFIYPHPIYNQALETVKKAIFLTESSEQPMSALLTGVTGTGKSTLIKTIVANYPKSQNIETEDAVIRTVPAYHCTVPADATIKALATEMLKYLDSSDLNGDAASLTKRLSRLLKTCKTKVIFLDEFQHLLSKKARNGGDGVTDWVKTLMDATGVPVILSGMPECEAIIDAHPQLAGRYSFRAHLKMIPYDINNPLYLSKVIEGFTNGLKNHVGIEKMPILTNDDYLTAFHVATGGNMRSLRHLFTGALHSALSDNRNYLTEDDFISVCEDQQLNYRLTSNNPFLNDYQKNREIIAGNK
tara:strand:- start:5697 stop:6632 length:936 start_codon:yes stop_codon:yes gene_type:complete